MLFNYPYDTNNKTPYDEYLEQGRNNGNAYYLP